jgi:Phospholipase_D-nuclease N-terminal
MFRALAVIAAFALLVYALADFANSDERDRGGIPRWLWVLIIVVLVYFGPLAWIVFSHSRRVAAKTPSRGGGSFPQPRTAPSRRRPDQPVAPDDDPDFLWKLAREQRRQQAAQAGNGEGAKPTTENPPQKDTKPTRPDDDSDDHR